MILVHGLTSEHPAGLISGDYTLTVLYTDTHTIHTYTYNVYMGPDGGNFESTTKQRSYYFSAKSGSTFYLVIVFYLGRITAAKTRG